MIDDFDQKVKELINTEIKKKLKPLTDKLDLAVRRITELEGKLKFNEVAAENQIRANNVTISGIPLIQNENLGEVIDSISCKLSFQQLLASTARRFPSSDPSKSIINLKFYSQTDKLTFLNAYFKIQPRLLLKDVTGRSSDRTRIYINHDLSKTQYAVHKLSMKLKRDGKIKAVKVINGQVAVFKDKYHETNFHRLYSRSN